MKETSYESKGEVVIGLPNALLYSRYQVLWESFFAALGIKTIVSEPTNKEILQLGTDVAIDESCLSVKIFLGHVHSLIGKCDFILIPRISDLGRQLNMCTRFEALYDLSCNIFRHTHQKFISYNIAVSKKMTEKMAFLELGSKLGFSKKAAKEAYNIAKKKEFSDWKKRVKNEEQLYKSDRIKIVIAAHKYLAEDAYFGRPIMTILENLGTVPIRADIVDREEALKQSLKVSPTLKWVFSREIMGSLQMHRDKIDGIIMLSAFPCGPDSMVNDIIRREFSEIPMLNLVLDSQSGTAGIETRLESFIDIIKFRKGEL